MLREEKSIVIPGASLGVKLAEDEFGPSPCEENASFHSKY